MYVSADGIIKFASLFAAVCALAAAVISVYKVFAQDKRQTQVIKNIQEEQTVMCYGLRGALQGLIEQGCDGPCKDALALLDKHLNKVAHKSDL